MTADNEQRFAARSSGILLVVFGLLLAGPGLVLALRAADTGELVTTGKVVRSGRFELSKAELLAMAARLEAASTSMRSADEAAALTFLYYAAAEDSAREGDTAGRKQQLATARQRALQTLSMAPTRADVSLVLAEIEYLSGESYAEVARALLLSYLTAPRELWIIERRIGLGLRLAPIATPELTAHIVGDIRVMGEPFRDPTLYLELARAAYAGGPYAIALVRRELAAIHDQPLHVFNYDLEQLKAAPDHESR